MLVVYMGTVLHPPLPPPPFFLASQSKIDSLIAGLSTMSISGRR